jgi:virginiamycin B lyase
MQRRAALTTAATVSAFFSLLFLPATITVQAQRGGQPVQLPEGAGKAMTEKACASCHALTLIPNAAGFSQPEWNELIASMIALPKGESDVITAYLAQHFPQKPDYPKAVIVPGAVNVRIREWMAPTLGQRPHDPLAARDGSIWWTGQFANRLGRVDPRTGAIKEYPLETPNSGPHGLVEDRDGNIWYTGINVQEIGKLDPKSGAVTEYKIPDPAVRGPHTPIFDQKGMFFFTTQSGHVGRLNPATGEFKLGKAPTENAYPYGIVVNSKGVPWYVDFRGNRVASVNPDTMEIKEYTLPDPAARPRRIAITPDDVVWYTDYARGYLGRFDPATGQVREWLSPGGKDSRPYGIAPVGDIIWYSESAVKPNTMVRFDTKTASFQTFVIPSSGGIVRMMMATPEGNLVLACSGVNRVALVEVGTGRRAN